MDVLQDFKVNKDEPDKQNKNFKANVKSKMAISRPIIFNEDYEITITNFNYTQISKELKSCDIHCLYLYATYRSDDPHFSP